MTLNCEIVAVVGDNDDGIVVGDDDDGIVVGIEDGAIKSKHLVILRLTNSLNNKEKAHRCTTIGNTGSGVQNHQEA